ncbi:hypothetical protein [Symbioplanes lichenis]|uniref:hypothetical protein n=1 Tax=Symbioplanes lichenis TaxID=1629072 RepID=UPI00273A4C01|nr:hypothetical protein [Actinoplanes lichenis]
MSSDDDLAGMLRAQVFDVLEWLGDYPAEQVDPAAVAAFRRSNDWLIERAPAGLPLAVGLFNDLIWWLDACPDEDVEEYVAVKLLESVAYELGELPAAQQRRFVEVAAELAGVERHDDRRAALLYLPYGFGLAPEQNEEPEQPGPWAPAPVRPEK